MSALEDYAAMRQKIKKPMTERAKQQLCGKLDKRRYHGRESGMLLNEAILHCWQSVYVPDGWKEGARGNADNAELIREKLRKVITSDQPLTTLMDIERERRIAELCNRESGSLTGVDCPECRNRGYFHRVDETGRRYIEPCACMEKRKSLERMARSGLSELLTRYTLQNWRTPEPWQRKAKQMALQYAQQPAGWFVMSGLWEPEKRICARRFAACSWTVGCRSGT